ncbi:hypothetical protein BN2497_1245 [Janthinobacterium sp. CG23_2]|nr:hypothetical protein BN2497_1245 [Janthinobacterium sp. CG23_2]CUU27020.1 hypothetical protein BN3177_1245 [Janthinobacterium sp. CG23_2]
MPPCAEARPVERPLAHASAEAGDDGSDDLAAQARQGG